MSSTQLTAVVVGLALAATAVWILRPLQRPVHRLTNPNDDRWRELIETKHQLYRSILDLEFDSSVGKVSDEDYIVLRRQQEGEALAVLKELDEIAAARQRAPGGGLDERDGVSDADGLSGAGGPAGAVAVRLEDRLEGEIAAARQRLQPQSPRAHS
ncbi:MAG: hypothetical protein ACRDJU_04460 [Actinomycetota bacterium]